MDTTTNNSNDFNHGYYTHVAQNGNTHLHEAITSDAHYVNLILQSPACQADINKQNSTGDTPLHLAIREMAQCQAKNPFPADLPEMDDHGGEYRVTLFPWHDKIDIINALLDVPGINVPAENNAHETPFQLARELISDADCRRHVVSILLARGAVPNAVRHDTEEFA